MLQEDLLDFAGDDGGVQLAGQGRHLVQAGAGCEGDSQAESLHSQSLPVDVAGNAGGLIPIIFLWAASGSSSGFEPCCERFGSEPNLRVLGRRGLSNGALISGILGLEAGSPANKTKFFTAQCKT